MKRRRYTFATILVGKSSLRREGLAKILRAANFRIFASVSCADDLIARKAQSCQLLFLVVHTGDDFDIAVEHIELFKERHPNARITVVADHYRLDEVVSAFRAGVNGFFVDVMTCDAFIKSLELVMMGETVFPPAFLAFAFDSDGGSAREAGPRDDDNQTMLVSADEAIARQLSPREKSILRCLIEGDSNKCIARKIDIAEATVKVHVKAILRKIRVQNRTQAAIWGMNNRSLAPPANSGLQHLSPEAGQRHPSSAHETGEIKQEEAKLPPEVINHGTDHAAGANRFIRNGAEAAGVIRLRK